MFHFLFSNWPQLITSLYISSSHSPWAQGWRTCACMGWGGYLPTSQDMLFQMCWVPLALSEEVERTVGWGQLLSPELAFPQGLHKDLTDTYIYARTIYKNRHIDVYFICVFTCAYAHTFMYAQCICVYIFCTWMYAHMYMLVYLWAGNPLLISPGGEFPAGKPSLPPSWSTVPGQPHPPEKALLGAEAEPRTSPGPASCCRRKEKDPKPGTAPPSMFLPGVPADTQVGPGHPGTAIGWKYSLLGGQGKERSESLFSLLFFVSVWERLQAPSLKSHLRCFRAKVNSPHGKIKR